MTAWGTPLGPAETMTDSTTKCEEEGLGELLGAEVGTSLWLDMTGLEVADVSGAVD